MKAVSKEASANGDRAGRGRTAKKTVAKKTVAKKAVAKKNVAPPGKPEERWLSLKEVAAVLDTSYWSVTKWTSSGEFCPKAVRLPNGQIRVRYDDLMAWVRKLPRA